MTHTSASHQGMRCFGFNLWSRQSFVHHSQYIKFSGTHTSLKHGCFSLVFVVPLLVWLSFPSPSLSVPLVLHSSHRRTSLPPARDRMFSSLSDDEPLLGGQPVRVYRPVQLNSLFSRMADIYVLWLTQPLLANYPADQSEAQSASCFHPPWQFVSQACCSATDAARVRVPLCCSCKSCSNVNRSGCGVIFVACFGDCECVSTVYTHTHTICVHASGWYICALVCLHHASLQSWLLSYSNLWVLSCAAHTHNRSTHCVFTVFSAHMMHMVYALWTALKNLLGCCNCIFPRSSPPPWAQQLALGSLFH